MKRIGKTKGRLGKLIEPFEKKIKYFSKFNENLLSIRKDTKTSIKDNFSLVKKQDEIYNNFVKKIINTYHEKNLINNNNNHLEKKLHRNYSNPNFSKK